MVIEGGYYLANTSLVTKSNDDSISKNLCMISTVLF